MKKVVLTSALLFTAGFSFAAVNVGGARPTALSRGTALNPFAMRVVPVTPAAKARPVDEGNNLPIPTDDSMMVPVRPGPFTPPPRSPYAPPPR